jgi:hypothetical protein
MKEYRIKMLNVERGSIKRRRVSREVSGGPAVSPEERRSQVLRRREANEAYQPITLNEHAVVQALIEQHKESGAEQPPAGLMNAGIGQLIILLAHGGGRLTLTPYIVTTFTEKFPTLRLADVITEGLARNDFYQSDVDVLVSPQKQKQIVGRRRR